MTERTENRKDAAGILRSAACAARVGNHILGIIAAVLVVVMLLYGGYSLWDMYRTYRGAFADEELMKYKPAGEGKENPTLDELMKINPDVCAWLTVDDTNIDYPVVQGDTNMEYINKDVYGEFALSGSIFLDCQNKRDFSDCYNLLYGHHMNNGAMFGDIVEFVDKKYFKKHRTGTLYLPEDTYKISFLACVKADATDAAIFDPDAQSKETLSAFLSDIKDRSVQYEDIGMTAEYTLIGLSTCAVAETNGRVILFGRLEK